MKILAGLCLCGAAFAQQVQTAWRPEPLKKAGIEQKMGAKVPLDVPFIDDSGHPATLRSYLGKPVILALVYYQCPSLCDLVLNGVVRSAKALSLDTPKDFQVVAVSFDPRETPELARAKKQAYLKEYGREGAAPGWHFLTGPEQSSRAVADALGFHYAYDAVTNQYAHASGIMILTPDGRVTRYFYGIEYPARDVKLGLIEASRGSIGSVVDQVLLYCYHYDPSNGKYGLVIMNALRIAGVLTVAALATFMIVMLRRDFKGAH
jgi:protein SCO1/2